MTNLGLSKTYQVIVGREMEFIIGEKFKIQNNSNGRRLKNI